MRHRQHPRSGRLRAVRHDSPVEEGVAELVAETVPEPFTDRVSRETHSDGEVRPLSKDRIARLEALTAVWVREVRVGGPQPDDTLLYAAPKPPPPPRSWPDETEAAIRRAQLTVVHEEPEPYSVEAADELVRDLAEDRGVPAKPREPRVVRDWSSRHDPRSKSFDVAARLAARVPVQDRAWRTGPIFDQGTTPPLSLHDASGCTGMAAAAAANVLALAAGRADLLTKDDALALYGRAQQLDHISGEAYAGTSVLAVMKAGQEAGLWPGYTWAFGTRNVAQALLQLGPVVVGIPWDTALEEPDANGIVRPGGSPNGGHALALVGLKLIGGAPHFIAQQSRGPAVGDHGLIYFHHKDLSRLLAGVGEAAIPTPP